VPTLTTTAFNEVRDRLHSKLTEFTRIRIGNCNPNYGRPEMQGEEAVISPWFPWKQAYCCNFGIKQSPLRLEYQLPEAVALAQWNMILRGKKSTCAKPIGSGFFSCRMSLDNRICRERRSP